MRKWCQIHFVVNGIFLLSRLERGDGKNVSDRIHFLICVEDCLEKRKIIERKTCLVRYDRLMKEIFNDKRFDLSN